MARKWRDPRDGHTWLIVATPFEGPMGPDPAGVTQVGWQLVFNSEAGDRTILVSFEVGARMEKMKDEELIKLLDAARSPA